MTGADETTARADHGPARPPLVIVGPTATGKSALALALARRHAGVEIVSADAMAVYRGMRIGTAAPTAAEAAEVPHHVVGVVAPSEEYGVARFQADAEAALAAIEQGGGTPVMVGGTGLYVRAVVDGFTLPGRYPATRAEVEAEPSTGTLWRRLAELDPEAAEKTTVTNRRRIVRALEVTVGSGRPFSSYGPGVDHYPDTRFRLIGLRLPRPDLDRRIADRYLRQVDEGFLDEVAALDRRSWSRTAARALGYAELGAYLDGETDLEQALAEATVRTRRFARRQERWFRRDPRIVWFEADRADLVDAVDRWWSDPAQDPHPPLPAPARRWPDFPGAG
ncbi:MAG: tRNA (adenosine(37)-N6)-dimethylallyltransferase MiaA [Acidimicrobiales bacterium]